MRGQIFHSKSPVVLLPKHLALLLLLLLLVLLLLLRGLLEPGKDE